MFSKELEHYSDSYEMNINGEFPTIIEKHAKDQELGEYWDLDGNNIKESVKQCWLGYGYGDIMIDDDSGFDKIETIDSKIHYDETDLVHSMSFKIKQRLKHPGSPILEISGEIFEGSDVIDFEVRSLI